MSLASSLLVGFSTVALAPLNYFVRPVLSVLWLLVNHLVLIPCLLVIRIFLYGVIYLPLTVLLSVARVSYDSAAPVEIALYRLAVTAWPHMVFLFVNLVHYFILSAIIGVAVGVVSGTNMSLVGYVLTWLGPRQSIPKATQTTPFFNAKAEQVWNKHATSVKHELKLQSGTDAHMPGISSLKEPSSSMHGLHSLDLESSSHHDLSFPTIKEESEPEDQNPLTQEEIVGPGHSETFSSAPSLFSKAHNGDTFSTAVSNRGETLKKYKHASG